MLKNSLICQNSSMLYIVPSKYIWPAIRHGELVTCLLYIPTLRYYLKLTNEQGSSRCIELFPLWLLLRLELRASGESYFLARAPTTLHRLIVNGSNINNRRQMLNCLAI